MPPDPNALALYDEAQLVTAALQKTTNTEECAFCGKYLKILNLFNLHNASAWNLIRVNSSAFSLNCKRTHTGKHRRSCKGILPWR